MFDGGFFFHPDTSCGAIEIRLYGLHLKKKSW